MDLSLEELEAAKAYMRVDGNDDDSVVKECLLGARAYLMGAGISLPAPGTLRRASYDICAHRLALDDYDERKGVTHEKAEENPAFRRRFNQLKFDASVPDSDTEANGA